MTAPQRNQINEKVVMNQYICHSDKQRISKRQTADVVNQNNEKGEWG